MAQVVIASRLGDGLVVFVAEGARNGSVEWVRDLERAALAEDEGAAEALLALGEADARARHEVVDPYLIDVVREDGGLRPTKYREAIRCLGPTNRKDLGLQAEGPEA